MSRPSLDILAPNRVWDRVRVSIDAPFRSRDVSKCSVWNAGRNRSSSRNGHSRRVPLERRCRDGHSGVGFVSLTPLVRARPSFENVETRFRISVRTAFATTSVKVLFREGPSTESLACLSDRSRRSLSPDGVLNFRWFRTGYRNQSSHRDRYSRRVPLESPGREKRSGCFFLSLAPVVSAPSSFESVDTRSRISVRTVFAMTFFTVLFHEGPSTESVAFLSCRSLSPDGVSNFRWYRNPVRNLDSHRDEHARREAFERLRAKRRTGVGFVSLTEMVSARSSFERCRDSVSGSRFLIESGRGFEYLSTRRRACSAPHSPVFAFGSFERVYASFEISDF
ncbi:hypothetical protein AVEN_201048-1 [Araneus ventricosus]|uniref:Uncharacterized protein n=1 Tax=Araneus ventricosus TaxID=182803 RepID=A0A4Y2E6P7_ARAVE|nr:hypothetical protein AVEN_201048-1 [Araneus ventricosus]